MGFEFELTVLAIISIAICDNSCMDEYNRENLPPSMRSLSSTNETRNETKLDEGYMDNYMDNGQYAGLQLDLYDDPDPYDKKTFGNSDGLDYGNDSIFLRVDSSVPRKNAVNGTTKSASPATSTQKSNVSSTTANIAVNAFDNFTGDLVGWRKVDIREFPYVVSLMHQKYKVHICTGTLLTSKVVLSYIRCVVRRKKIADKVVFTVAEAYQIIVAAGLTSLKIRDANTIVFRHVDLIITTYDNAFKGHLVFLMLEKEVPYSIYHRPVKLHSMDLKVVGRKLQEHVGKSFCEVITWEDTIICSESKILRPKNLKAYRVKILEADECSTQELRLGVRSSGDWSIKSDEPQTHCFVGMGGRRCGSAPGGPVVCGNSIYGIMSLGTSCSEFGDYTNFIPLNTSEIYLLYRQTIEVEMETMQVSLGCLKTATWTLIISLIYVSLQKQ